MRALEKKLSVSSVVVKLLIFNTFKIVDCGFITLIIIVPCNSTRAIKRFLPTIVRSRRRLIALPKDLQISSSYSKLESY